MLTRRGKQRAGTCMPAGKNSNASSQRALPMRETPTARNRNKTKVPTGTRCSEQVQAANIATDAVVVRIHRRRSAQAAAEKRGRARQGPSARYAGRDDFRLAPAAGRARDRLR